MTCQHEWVFSTPGHIRCTKCPAIGQRWLSKGKRAEFKLGRWIYIGRRYAKPAREKQHEE